MPAQKVVAVAGGSGSIGRSIVGAILADGKFQVIILGRKVLCNYQLPCLRLVHRRNAPREPLTSEWRLLTNEELSKTIGARIVAINYSNIDSIVKVLRENNVHTLISALALGGGTPAESEIALIRAADRCDITKRFITSNWGVKYSEKHADIPLAAAKVKAAFELEKTENVEWTAVCNGLFLDYWGFPNIKSYLAPMTLVVDMAAKKAAIPGSGEVSVVFTYSEDVAKYTAALLTLDKWERESYIVGDSITWNEFVELAEDVTGMKLDITYDSPNLLESGKVTELPSHVPAYAFLPKETLQGVLSSIELFFHHGLFDFGPRQTMNAVFPHIKPKSVKDVLEIGWKK